MNRISIVSKITEYLKSKLIVFLVFIQITLLVFSFGINPRSVKAQLLISDDARSAAYAQLVACMSDPIRDFMLALAAASANGTIGGNVGLLSPAFNMTSDSFGLFANDINNNGAMSQMDGIAGNLYTTGEVNDIGWYLLPENQNIVNTFSQPIYITESGVTRDSEQSNTDFIEDAVQVLSTYGPDQIAGITLFNAFNSNQQFEYHSWTDAEIQSLCSQVSDLDRDGDGNRDGNCSSIGVNYAGSTTDFSRAESYGMGYVVNIVNQGTNVGALANAIDSFSGTAILRIGVGNEAGFVSTQDYINFLSELSGLTNKQILAIAGPNEPDLEFWIAPECMNFVIEYLMGQYACGSPFQFGPLVYPTEVIGHNGRPPWSLNSNVYDETVGTNADLDELADKLNATFYISAYSNYNYDDFELVSRQMTGALQDTSDLYYGKRVENANYLDIPALNAMHPGKDLPGSFGISTQPTLKIGESTETYLKRIFKDSESHATKPDLDGTEFGYITEMPTILFRACLQRPYCDPARDKCLRKEKGTGFCNDSDTPTDCVNVGRIFTLRGKITHEEPTDLHSISRSYSITKSWLADQPGKPITMDEIFKPADLAAYYSYDNSPTPNNDLSMATPTSNLLQDSSVKDQSTSIDNQLVGSITDTITDSSSVPSVVSTIGNGIKEFTDPKVAHAQTFPQAESQLGATATLGADGRYNITYSFCLWAPANDSPCNIRDVNGNINGNQIFSMGTYRILGPGSANQVCYRPEWGNAPAISSLPAPTVAAPRQCTIISASARGGRVGPEGCGDEVSQSCEICTVLRPNGSVEIEQTCGIIPPPPPADCRVCESWAPKNLCHPIDVNEIKREIECSSGNCNTGSDPVKIDEINYDKIAGGGDEDPSFIDLTLAGATDWARSVLNYFFSTSNFFGLSGLVCHLEVLEVDADGKPTKEKRACWFNNKDYSLFAFPMNFEGDFKDKSEYMGVQNAMFLSPGKTDTYFKPQSTMIPIQLKLSIGNISATNSANNVDIDFGNSVASEDQSFWDSLPGTDEGEAFFDALSDDGYDNKYYVGLNDSGIRVMYVEFWEFYQPQLSGHCVKLRSLVQDYNDGEREVPNEQNGVCNTMDFWQTGVGRDNDAPLVTYNNKTTLQAYAEKYIGGVDKNLAAFNLNDEIKDQLKNDFVSNSLSAYEKSPASKYYSFEESTKITNDFTTELNTIVNKYKIKYPKLDLEKMENWPEDFKNEINSLGKRYSNRYIPKQEG